MMERDRARDGAVESALRRLTVFSSSVNASSVVKAILDSHSFFWGGIFRERKRHGTQTHVFQLIDRIEGRSASARGPRPPIAATRAAPGDTPTRLAEQPLEHDDGKSAFLGEFCEAFCTRR